MAFRCAFRGHIFKTAFYSNKDIYVAVFFSRILVGAPLADNLQPETSRSGGLFRCDIPELGTIYDNYCQQVPTDGRRCTYAITDLKQKFESEKRKHYTKHCC